MSTAQAAAERPGARRPHASREPADFQTIEDLPPYANVQQVAEFLGQPVSTVRYWVQIDYIPSVRLGRSRRFPREALRTWLEEQERSEATG